MNFKGIVSRNSAKLGITKCPLNPRETLTYPLKTIKEGQNNTTDATDGQN